MERYGILIKTDETGKSNLQICKLRKDVMELKEMYSLCDCSCIEIAEPYVKLTEDDTEVQMIFDEEFLLKNSPGINPLASYVYGYNIHGECLCGNVLLVKTELVDDEIEMVGFTPEEALRVFLKLGEISLEIVDMQFKLQKPYVRFVSLN